MKKICFVVQRYGMEISGGAEYLCRLYAERMLQYYDVEVVTSCAKDYLTWKNEYQSGMEQLNGVTVWRFPCVAERDLEVFDLEFRKYLGNERRDICDDFHWLKQNGPECPGIFEFIHEHKTEFDIFIFMGYLYYSTTFCLQEVAEKAILIPTAHDEVALNACESFRAMYQLPAGFIFLTQAEKRFVYHKFGNVHIPSVVTGSGVTLPATNMVDAQKSVSEKFGVGQNDYIVYVGRITVGKSCDLLLRSFIEYKEKYRGDTKLVLIGKTEMEIPDREDIIQTGFVTEEEKFVLLRQAKMLIMPSRQESLCIAVLEAMAVGIPVVVNAGCDVLKDHVIDSNGGLYFHKKVDFAEVVDYLLKHPEIRKQMGENGKRYVDEHYAWEAIDRKIVDLAERVMGHERK